MDAVAVLREVAKQRGPEIGLSYVIFFGPVARGDLQPLSDVDIAVKFRGMPSILALGNKLADLEDAFRRRIDVVPAEDYSCLR